jgi:indole-3-glycerol phosphate synthase
VAARGLEGEGAVNLLARIVAQKHSEIDAARRRPAPSRTPAGPRGKGGHGSLDVVQALRRPAGESLRLLAEVKFKSPSAGELSRVLDAPSRAVAYAEGGARVVSILCDSTFFGGSFDDLWRARQAFDARGLAVPLLAKEFIVDPIQIEWAVAHGADAVLIIARILRPDQVDALAREALARGLEPLIEVTTEVERDVALEMGARIVGVNARDLDTLAIDGTRAARILAGIPADRVAVHLSGVKSSDDIRAIAAGRAAAALIGEVLMREADPTPVLRNLVSAAGHT